MSDGQLCHRALLDANRRIAELQRQMVNSQQRVFEAERTHFDNLRTAYASIARLREALTEAREHLADATPEETRAKIDDALQGAPMISGQVADGAPRPRDRSRRTGDAHLVFLSLAPTSPPFSTMNSTPAAKCVSFMLDLGGRSSLVRF